MVAEAPQRRFWRLALMTVPLILAGEVEIRLPDGSVLKQPSRLSYVDPGVDPKNGTLLVRLRGGVAMVVTVGAGGITNAAVGNSNWTSGAGSAVNRCLNEKASIAWKVR